MGGYKSNWWKDPKNEYLLKEWIDERNIENFPSSYNATWKCKCGVDHIWIASPDVRIRGSGCPYCANRKLSITNSLATCYPELAKEWHQTKNGCLTPNDVVAGGKGVYWWKCPDGTDHEWEVSCEARIRSIRLNNKGCPFCSGKFVSVTNNLATCFPKIAEQWHPTKNINLTPHDLVAGSHKVVWWKCPCGDDHEWERSLAVRIDNGGHGCPFCNNHYASKTNNLAINFPEISKEWHPIKNGNLTANDVVAGSNKSAWMLLQDLIKVLGGSV